MYCHTIIPPVLTSPNHQITFHFHSDGSGTDVGFQFLYNAESMYQGCGGVFSMKSGEFGSPTISGKYPDGLNCEYLIQTIPGSKIKLKFTSMNIENNAVCRYDRVTVRIIFIFFLKR